MGTATFHNHYHVPIFIVLYAVVITVVGIRLLVFLRNFSGWKSFRGISTVLILVGALLITVYTALLCANWFMNMDYLSIRRRDPAPHEKNPGRYKYRDPAEMRKDEIDEIIVKIARLIKLEFVQRFFLTLALWMVKFAFLSIFLETKETLRRHTLGFLYFTCVIIVLTFILAMWNTVKDMTEGIYALVPNEAQIRRGALYHGVRFIYQEPVVEYICAGSNVVTDFLLLIIAWKTVRSFRVPLINVILPCVIIGTTIILAIGRIVVITCTLHIPTYYNHLAIPFQMFTECETYFAIIVSCLPGLRAFLRRLGSTENSLGELRRSVVQRGEEVTYGSYISETLVVSGSNDGRCLSGSETEKGKGKGIEEIHGGDSGGGGSEGGEERGRAESLEFVTKHHAI